MIDGSFATFAELPFAALREADQLGGTLPTPGSLLEIEGTDDWAYIVEIRPFQRADA